MPTNTINTDYAYCYAQKLELAKEYHEGVKSGKYPREHSYTLTYAKKEVNELAKKYELAVKLWGDRMTTTDIKFEDKTYTCRIVKSNFDEDLIIGSQELLILPRGQALTC